MGIRERSGPHRQATPHGCVRVPLWYRRNAADGSVCASLLLTECMLEGHTWSPRFSDGDKCALSVTSTRRAEPLTCGACAETSSDGLSWHYANVGLSPAAWSAWRQSRPSPAAQTGLATPWYSMITLGARLPNSRSEPQADLRKIETNSSCMPTCSRPSKCEGTRRAWAPPGVR